MGSKSPLKLFLFLGAVRVEKKERARLKTVKFHARTGMIESNRVSAACLCLCWSVSVRSRVGFLQGVLWLVLLRSRLNQGVSVCRKSLSRAPPPPPQIGRPSSSQVLHFRGPGPEFPEVSSRSLRKAGTVNSSTDCWRAREQAGPWGTPPCCCGNENC